MMTSIEKRLAVIRAAQDSHISSTEEAQAAIEFVLDLVHIQLKEMKEDEPWAEDSIRALEEMERHLGSLDVDLADELDGIVLGLLDVDLADELAEIV